MTLKEELEILRGEAIGVLDGDPMDIPCIETSDREKLCRKPLVSVHMITYNHEPCIRQAIEGVMMQKTDFEFELVIGEDCSQDKTREICMEYQKRYPDKIRILWWYENVSKFGGNGRRVTTHCRGDFIAFCEGDDYWIDPLKLQKQVEVMRKYPNVGFCFCGSKIYHGDSGLWEQWDEDGVGFEPGHIPARRFMLWTICGKHPTKKFGPEFFVMTATCFVRVQMLKRAMSNLEIFKWRMLVGDSVLWLGMSSVGDVYYLKDVVSVYRQMPSGVTLTARSTQSRETFVVRFYYFKKFFTSQLDILPRWLRMFFSLSMLNDLKGKSRDEQKAYYSALRNKIPDSDVFKGLWLLPCRLLLRLGCYKWWCAVIAKKICTCYCRCIPDKISRQLMAFYEECNERNCGEAV